MRRRILSYTRSVSSSVFLRASLTVSRRRHLLASCWLHHCALGSHRVHNLSYVLRGRDCIPDCAAIRARRDPHDYRGQVGAAAPLRDVNANPGTFDFSVTIIEYICLRFLGFNLLSAYRRAQLSAMAIGNRLSSPRLVTSGPKPIIVTAGTSKGGSTTKQHSTALAKSVEVDIGTCSQQVAD